MKGYKLNQVKLIHNGMNITWHEDEEQALSYIQSVVNDANTRVRLYPCSDTKVPCNDVVDDCKEMRIITYQYYTHYMEVFVLKYV